MTAAMLTQDELHAWSSAIAARYGVQLLRKSDLFIDRGYIFAGSKYIATLGTTNCPAAAYDWTPIYRLRPVAS